MATSYIPADHNHVSPYLIAEGASGLVEFLEKVFGAEEVLMMRGPGGIIMHGEVRIGETIIMVAEACEHARPNNAMLHVYVPDVDAAYRRAIEAGATAEREVADQFYGDRSGGVRDAFGNTWYIATHVEDVSPEEIDRRQKEMKEKSS